MALQNLIASLKININLQLPGIKTQMLMAPPVRNTLQKAPSNAKQGAVAILLYVKNKEWHIVLMRRTQDGGVHSGQISLPGGKCDAQDLSYTYTALRELQEEMGVAIADVQILGNLTPLYIPPSNFVVQAILCYTMQQITFTKSDAEVNEIIEIPLQTLLDPNSKSITTVLQSDNKNNAMQVPIYKINENIKIWGATAMMLSELEALLLK